MKIALVNPYQRRLVSRKGKIYNRVWPPLELANTGAVLEGQGHEVRIVDANAMALAPEKVADLVSGFDKVFVSSSSLDRWQCPCLDIEPFLNAVCQINRVSDEIYVIGVHGTVKPAEILELTRAKAVIRGEPEITVAELCEGRPLSEIKGLAFREAGKVILTEEQRPVDLNNLPKPAFHLLPMNRYHYEVLGYNFTLFEGSRGCASKCRFCLLKMYGLGVRRKKLEKLIEEVEYAIASFGIKRAYFMDLEFTVFRDQVLDLCDYLSRKRYDFCWTCQTRLDLVDEHLLRKMKQAGCRLIHFGVEAGGDGLLARVNKKITIRQIEEGMHLVHQADIDSACFFMLGFPNSDAGEMEETINFAKKLNPTYALFHIATPYPATVLYDQVLQEDSDVFGKAMFPEAFLQGEDLIKLKKVIRHAYLEFYLRPTYVGSRLLRGDLRSLSGQIKLLLGYL
ncbi:MAG: B12-binding domain-containing radical SAM protein [Acidobacteriia bacterium]|nr:B12-binding domain-containing radical SAM protein [Terriglobia bacterium]